MRVLTLRGGAAFALMGSATFGIVVGCEQTADTDAASRPDATTSDVVVPGDSDSSPGDDSDASPGDAQSNVPPATILAIQPRSVPYGQPFSMRVDAIGVAEGARVFIDGVPAAASTGDAGLGVADATSDAGEVRSLYVSVRGVDVNASGLLPVIIENAPGSRSAPIFLQVGATDGGIRVFDISPDNGRPGDTIRVLGYNLDVGAFTIADEQGKDKDAVLEFNGLTQWGTVGGVEFAEFVVPKDWHSGQLTVTREGVKPPVRTPVFTIGANLSRNGTVAVSSFLPSPSKPGPRAIDGNLLTSWFADEKNCVSDPACTAPPHITVSFAATTKIGRVALRGNREYRNQGYDFLRGRIEILGPAPAGDAGARPILATRHVELPWPNHDGDVIVSPAVAGNAVRFVSEGDEQINPGMAELEVYEN